MSNVMVLPGVKPPVTGTVNIGLVNLLESMLEKARLGELQSLIGTGYLVDGCRLSFFADQHEDIYQMLGALVWLQAEYQAKHPFGAKT